MIRNLLLTGGPGHEFDPIAGALDELFREQGIDTIAVSDPDAMIAMLARATDDQRVDLLTVHALRWGMGAERYAHLREEQAYRLSSADAAVIKEFVVQGGGLLALHPAVICFDAEPTWRELCGAAWNWERSSHPPVGEAEVVITDAGRDHPITAGLDDFTIHDEIYGFLDEGPDLVALLSSGHGGREHPLLWAHNVGSGRVVTDLLGHGIESIDHPIHRSVLRRAAMWATGHDNGSDLQHDRNPETMQPATTEQRR